MVNYYEYIRSAEWKAVKLRYLRSGLPKDCGVCGAKWNNSMEFHHKTYKRLGREWLMDIRPVCRSCHQKVHELHDRKRNKGLWGALKGARRIHQKGPKP